MSLNIKNDETYRLTQELSNLTGESLTTAVTVAVRERLDRLQSEAEPSNLAERLMEIGRKCSVNLTEPWRSIDHGELLYGEDGLPR